MTQIKLKIVWEKKEQNFVVAEISDNGKVSDFTINISGSDEDKEQAELSMNVTEIITALSRSESIENLLYEKGEDDSDGKNKVCEKDTKSNEDESRKDVCNNDLMESIMTKMADMKELDSVESMELYRLNPFPAVDKYICYGVFAQHTRVHEQLVHLSSLHDHGKV